ncbi:DUF2344 domain-containing protein [bacterium]|nr:DUF2344 domain-containing protein [bacterium]
MDAQRILFRFRKEGQARFLSHHDLMRLVERALRRAALPVRMSEGYHPHPRLSIVLALPLGVAADDEALEVQFQPPVAPAHALTELQAQAPAGIAFTAADALPAGVRARVESVVYEATVPPEGPIEPAHIEEFLARDSMVIERSTPKATRSLDIRPAVDWVQLDGSTVRFQVRIGPGSTPRPLEVLQALMATHAAHSTAIPLRRTHLNLAPFPSNDEVSPRTPATEKATPNAT